MPNLMQLLIPVAILAGIFVNGATDAPGSLTGSVAGGALSFRKAALLCAVFNFIGMFFSYYFMHGVSDTVLSLSDFGKDSDAAVLASMLSVVSFASVAWALGIPTSESHAMLAAIAGAGICTGGGQEYISLFLTVAFRSALSCVFGFFAGYAAMRLLGRSFSCGRLSLRKSSDRLQKFTCAASSAFHGVQDGQKFLSLLAVSVGSASLGKAEVLLCCLVMGFGCFTGGKRIVDKLGYEVTGGLSREAGAASDIGAFITVAAASFAAVPVSTTYMKTCGIFGASAASGNTVNRRTAAQLILIWIATYPVCMGLSVFFFKIIGFIGSYV